MSEDVLPSSFLSHGPPSMVLDDLPVNTGLAAIGRDLPRPKAVLRVSAHWIAERSPVSLVAPLAESPETLHGFHGFPQPLFRLSYPAPGTPVQAHWVVELLADAGLDCAYSATRGLDHGAWEPLMLPAVVA